MEMLPAPATSCANPMCRVSADGKCIEGLQLTECSQYGRLPDLSGMPAESAMEKPVVHLPSAQLLSVTELPILLRASSSQVIAIIGPTGSGKTSLIAAVYDLLQLSRLNGATYVASSTLHAFELACHDARAQSRRTTPYTVRTRRGDVRFYHVDLIGGVFDTRTTLLLGDRAGEEYELACDDASHFDDFAELHRADCLTILVDGKKLADTKTRHNTINNVTLTFQGLFERPSLLTGRRVALVLTKWDEVLAVEDSARVESSFNAIVERMNGLFGSQATVTGFIVAASPHGDSVSLGSGVSDLVEFWSQRRMAMAKVLSSPNTGRLFDHFDAAVESVL